jgi:molecular chaperone DnaK (HSP70)
MNADEAVARGCALQCAILSSKFKVKDFSIIEAVPYPIRVSWEPEAGAAAATAADAKGEIHKTSFSVHVAVCSQLHLHYSSAQ